MVDRGATLDWAFALGLAGGLLILVGGVGMGSWMMGGGPWHMMGPGRTGAPTWWAGMGFFLAAWSLVAGLVAVVAAVGLRVDPAHVFHWGVALLVAGALSLVGMGMGGFVLGAGSAIVGGALAISASGQVAAGAGRAGRPQA